MWQNGKNEVVTMRKMWGGQEGEKILHTAHRTTTSHAAIEDQRQWHMRYTYFYIAVGGKLPYGVKPSERP